MVTILNIMPHYNSSKKGRIIEAFTVEFRYKKVITKTQAEITLEGSLVFPVESPVINFVELTNKIANYLINV